MPDGRNLAVADAAGTIFEVGIREGHLAFDCPVATLADQHITALSIAVDIPIAAVSTASGQVLTYTISRAADPGAGTFGAAVSAAAEHAAATAAAGADPTAVPDSSIPGGWQQQGSLQLDAAVSSLCLEPSRLQEGLVVTEANTVWYVSTAEGTTQPLVCGHPSPVLSLAAAPHDSSLVASTAEDGVLRIWSLGEVGC
jgi:WD40 repeat protein